MKNMNVKKMMSSSNRGIGSPTERLNKVKDVSIYASSGQVFQLMDNK